MTTVSDFIIEAWSQAPSVFTEREAALNFLQSDGNLDIKLELAITLLSQIAGAAECPNTWDTLVKQRLVAAEKAMRYLLPHHRDHVLHSAHLYLLGVGLYFKMLRREPVLAAVLSDAYYRDAQALYGNPDLPYSCTWRLIDPKATYAENAQRIGPKFLLNANTLGKLGVPCNACQPKDLTSWARSNAQTLRQFEHCCQPATLIREAIEALANAINTSTLAYQDVSMRLPKTPEELDQVFRRRWSQVAILHDAAYPMELAAKQIDDYIAATVKPLGCTFSPCVNPFGLQLNRVCDLLALPLVQNVCTTRLNPRMCIDNSMVLLATNISHKLHVEYMPDTLARMMLSWLENGLAEGHLDHGVFSALLMLRMINDELIKRLGERRQEPQLVIDDPCRLITDGCASPAAEYFYIDCVDAASAVYLHNTKKYVPLFKERHLDYRDHPYAWLLFLCDQLQEWLRPSGDEDPMNQFKRARQYSLDLVSGPKLYFDFPDKAAEIRELFRCHLRLFGEEFVKRAD